MTYDVVKDECYYRDIWFSRAFALFLNAVLIVDLFRKGLNNTNLTTFVQYAIYILLAIYVYYQIFIVNKMVISKRFFSFVVLLITITFASYMVTNEISQSFSYFIPFLILRIIPGIYLCLSLTKNRATLVLSELNKYKIIWFIYALIGAVMISIKTGYSNQYSMTFGYNLLLPAAFILYEITTKFKIRDIAFFLLFLGSILARGSRGSLFCLLIIGALVYIFIYLNDISNKKLIRIFLLLVIATALLLSYDTLLMSLSQLFPTSRTISMLSSGNITSEMGRSSIKELIIAGIKDNSVAFRGIFADRVFFGNAYGSNFDVTNHPHNIFYEMIYQFGVLGGSLIFVSLMASLISNVRHFTALRNKELVFLWIYLFASGFAKLILSSSYLLTVEFFMLMALSTNINGYFKMDCVEEEVQ